MAGVGVQFGGEAAGLRLEVGGVGFIALHDVHGPSPRAGHPMQFGGGFLQMSGARFLPAKDYALEKAATRQLVRLAGGVAQAATFTRVDPARLSRYGSPHDPQFVPIDVVADLEAEAGDPIVTRALADLSGCLLVAKPKADAARGMAATLGRTAKETGEALAALGSALADDGVITAAEAKASGLRREIAEAQAMLAQLDLLIAEVEADGE